MCSLTGICKIQFDTVIAVVYFYFQPLILNLLDIQPMMTALNGVVMELQDSAFPLLTSQCLFWSEIKYLYRCTVIVLYTMVTIQAILMIIKKTFQFKVDRLQYIIIAVAKKYICVATVHQ